jgi:penicillin-binding protein 2
MMKTGPWRPDDAGRIEAMERQGRSVHRSPDRTRALETPADRQRINGRAQILEWIVIGLVAALLLGFWQLQIVRGSYYTQLANENLLRQTRVRPARGLILDRNGAVLATNHAAYEVAVVREAIEDEEEVLRWLAGVLDEPYELLRERLDAQRGLPRFRPAVLATGATLEQVVAIEARRREHAGVQVQITAQRFYPRGITAAHVLGHVGEISPRQLERADERYRMGDIVGQQGVERMYNDALIGDAGSKLAVVNSVGREIQVLQENPPAPGQTVVLTLDAELQEKAEALLESRRGAIVAIDVATGGILALASAPSFDPNAFAERFSAEDWRALLEDPARPLHNRALQASLPPGSVFKIVMATAGLEEGIITADTKFFCAGGKTLYGRFFRCLGNHGSIDVVDAIAYSCNSFFYELGVKLGRERIVKWAQRFGLGGATGIDLPDEQDGIIPSDEWLAAAGLRYYPGDTVSIAIGQGRLAVSPLQLAHLASVAASGVDRQPHLLMRVEDSSTGRGATQSWSGTPRPAEFSEATRRTVLRGMTGSVAFGSSRRARLETVPVAGKTGTAQVASAENVARDNEDRPEFLRNHAWFVGVAPIDDPEIAIAVFLEHGGSGGGDAAPVGGELLGDYFDLHPDEVGIRQIPVTQEPVEPDDATDREGQR